MNLKSTLAGLIGALLALLALLASPSASADIKAFNSAMAAGDYARAVQEAQNTWPTLDKSRPDLPVIAREFGFAAIMAKEYAAAKTFAVAALGDNPATSDPLGSTAVLDAHAELKLSPSPISREQLRDALQIRISRGEADLIAILGADALVTYDLQKSKWSDAIESGRLGVALTETGGAGLLASKHTFALSQNIAYFMQTRYASPRVDVYTSTRALIDQLEADVESLPTDEAARPLINVYWQMAAWKESLWSYLANRNRFPKKVDADPTKPPAMTRLTRLTASRIGDDKCQASPQIKVGRHPEYPGSAQFRGLMGTVIMSFDTDASGKIVAHRRLASFPNDEFAEAVEASLRGMVYEPVVGGWDSSTCSLERKGRVMTYVFNIA